MNNSRICCACGLCCRININLGNEIDNNINKDYISKNKDILTKLGEQYWLSVNPEQVCSHLHGIVGEKVWCDIYSNRPPTCTDYPRNEVDISYCNSLRRKVGLPDITIEEFKDVI